MQSYGVPLDRLITSFTTVNSLVAAGALESESGRFAVKVPSLIETPEDIQNFPITATGDATVTLGDIAKVRPTFKDPTSITRVNGKPAITLEVSKRAGANLINTVDATRAGGARPPGSARAGPDARPGRDRRRPATHERVRADRPAVEPSALQDRQARTAG